MKPLFVATLVLTFLTNAVAAELTDTKTIDAKISREASTSAEIALKLAPIRSHDQLNAYIASAPGDRSPFSALRPTERQSFIESLKFNDQGLVEFDYVALRSLRPTQVYRLLALFGLQSSTYLVQSGAESKLDVDVNTPTLRADFEIDAYCDGAVCSRTVGKACVTQNCGSP